MLNKPVRILHVVGRMDRGGTETLLMNLFRRLNTEEMVFDFVVQTDDICDYDMEILTLGGKIYRCPALTISNIRKYRNWWIDFLKEHSEYEIIHGHSRGSAPIYLKAARKLNRRTIAHCHNNSNGKGLYALKRYVWQFPLRYIPEFCFACSMDSGYSQFGKRKFQVIYNGIDTEKYTWNASLRESYRKKFGIENNFVVGNVARFEFQKNHEFLIDIFAEIKKREKTAKLLLIGRGTREQIIREKAAKMGLSDDIIFAGLRSDVNNCMQALDVFVLPSHFEGLGIVNIEAQAAGLPCFVSEKVVPKEIEITDLVHFISLNESAADWAETILQNKQDVDLRRDTSEEIKKSGFDIESTKKVLVDFYQSLIEGGN